MRDPRALPFLRTALVAATALFIASCASVGPDYEAPANRPVVIGQAVPADPALAGLYSNAAPIAAWWSQFDDPVLAQLVSQALDANLDLRVALSRVDEARAVFSEARLDQLPHIPLDGSATRSRQQDPSAGGARTTSESAALGFDAGWEIDLFGRKRRASEAANADLGAERASLADVQVSVAAEVAREYFTLRGTQRRLDVARRTLGTLHDTLRLTEQLRDLGAGSELEVQGSLARVKAVEATIPQLEILEGQSAYRLAVLMGQRPGSLDALLAPTKQAPFAKALPIGDTRDLLRQRPDVRIAERRLASATARVGVAKADLFPRVSLAGFIGVLSGDVSRLFDGGTKAWSVTPSVSWAALDLGSVRARLRAADAQADGAAAQYEKAVLGALEDTEDSLLRYSRAQARLSLVVEQANASRRAAELADVRYRAGASDFLTLLDAQRTQLAADDALASAEADVNVGVVGVYKALGGFAAPLDAERVAVND